MFLQAVLIGIWAAIAGIEQFNGTESLHRPIVSGLVIGLILGDVKTGLIAGGTLELVWMGLVPLAGAQPPNIVIGGIVGVAFAILSKQEPEVAVGIAIPFAIVAQTLITLLFTAFSPVMHKADKFAEEANTRGIDRINYAGLIILGGFNFLIVFFVILLGADQLKGIVDLIPVTLMNGFKVASGMMPAVGFAMLLNIMLKKEYTPFLIVGFVLAAYLKLDVLAVALLGLGIALYDYYTASQKTTNNVSLKEEFEDGI